MEPEERVLFDGHPSWRSTPGFHIKGLAAAVIAGAIAGLATRIAAGHVQAGWVLVAVLAVFLLGLIAGALGRARTTYTITTERLIIRHGLLAHDQHETRLERIQNVHARQSVRERLLGVGTVEFDTASGSAASGWLRRSSESDFAFRGVANPRHIARTVNDALRDADQPPRTRTWTHER
jgi:uncharacterized membrane protein YdbT with pleckstrin-like domain